MQIIRHRDTTVIWSRRARIQRINFYDTKREKKGKDEKN